MQLESRLRRVVPTVQSLPARPPGDTNRGPALEHPPALSEGESLEGGIVGMALPCEIVPLCRASGRLWRGFPLSISRFAPRRCPSPAYACPRTWSMRGLCVSTTAGAQNRAIAPSRRCPREVARNDGTAVHPRTASNSSWRQTRCSWKSKKSSGPPRMYRRSHKRRARWRSHVCRLVEEVARSIASVAIVK